MTGHSAALHTLRGQLRMIETVLTKIELTPNLFGSDLHQWAERERTGILESFKTVSKCEVSPCKSN